MAHYDPQKLYKRAISQIKKHKLFFIEDIVAYLPCDKTTFYRLLPVGCNEYNNLKGMLDDNKVTKKVEIREKLLKGKGTELIALYKLIGNDIERKLLSTTYQEINEKVTIDKIDLSTLSTEELIARSKVVKDNE